MNEILNDKTMKKNVNSSTVGCESSRPFAGQSNKIK
jgi:hypothetical protein